MLLSSFDITTAKKGRPVKLNNSLYTSLQMKKEDRLCNNLLYIHHQAGID